MIRAAVAAVLVLGLGESVLGSQRPAHIDVLRGVNPKDLPHYNHNGPMFKCLDGSKEIPIKHVNDDYCDCPDGSDEPGTSACPTAQFFCTNKGHLPKVLASQFVDDSVCDCCDGSDEPKGHCPNTCFELGRHAREEMFRSAEAELKGAAIKAQRVHEYEVLKRQWAAEIERLDSTLIPQAHEAFLGAQKRKDALESEDEERRRALEAEQAAHSPPTGSEDLGAVPPPSLEVPPPVTADPVHGAGEEDDHLSGDVPPSPDAPGPLEEDPEEIGRRIASRWTHDPAAAGVHEDAPDDSLDLDADFDDDYGDLDLPEDAGEAGGEDVGEEEEGGAAGEQKGEEKPGLFGRFKNIFRRKTAESAPHPPSDGAGTEGAHAMPAYEPSPELVEARTAYQAAEKKWDDLRKHKKHLEEKLARSYGPDGALAVLLDKCVSKSVDKYEYETCLFGKAQQKEQGQAHGTLLGHFKSLTGDVMAFEGGQHCWQGPARSFRLRLVCGLEDQLVKVEEPSRCEYVGEMTTPSVCSEERGRRLKEEWAALEAEVAAAVKEL